jgi:hypothetical protein
MSRPALNDRQIGHMQFRLDLFARRGFTVAQAEALADRLAQRDYDRDDRRMCAECSNLQDGGTCFAAAQGWIPNTTRHSDWRHFTPVRTLLMRCEAFSFAKPA